MCVPKCGVVGGCRKGGIWPDYFFSVSKIAAQFSTGFGLSPRITPVAILFPPPSQKNNRGRTLSKWHRLVILSISQRRMGTTKHRCVPPPPRPCLLLPLPPPDCSDLHLLQLPHLPHHSERWQQQHLQCPPMHPLHRRVRARVDQQPLRPRLQQQRRRREQAWTWMKVIWVRPCFSGSCVATQVSMHVAEMQRLD